ncbi:MAG TPA: hypothetical protein VGM62_14710, partial [Chthoniobacterales bacterium]
NNQIGGAGIQLGECQVARDRQFLCLARNILRSNPRREGGTKKTLNFNLIGPFLGLHLVCSAGATPHILY